MVVLFWDKLKTQLNGHILFSFHEVEQGFCVTVDITVKPSGEQIVVAGTRVRCVLGYA
jgi:hypothetical protein